MTERTMPTTLTLLSCAVLTLVSGCFETRNLPAVIPGTGTSTDALIGAEGGSLMIDDLLVTFPAGALAADTRIIVTVEEPAGPSAFTLFSPVVTFEPAGLVLAQPVEIRIPFRGDGRIASVYTAQSGGGAFVPRTTQVVGDVAIAQIDYLASTFVGSACEGDDCACEPNGQLDLLVVIDNSQSMAEEQQLIREQLPELLGRLAIGDSDGDTVQDVAAFDSIRVGFVTTDMGTGPVTGIESCAEGFGDNGILVNGGGSDPACEPYTSSRIAEYSAGNPGGLVDFVVEVGCLGARGIDGCGFEQQLEAALVALSPSAPTAYTDASWSVPTYAEGRVGQGDLGNAGFLRDDSILAVLWVTDEEDCSTTDSQIFDRTDPRYSSIDLNLRCYSFPEQLQSVERFVAGIVGLRRRPEDVVVAAITGTPSGLVPTPGAIEYDAILSDPAMQETVDPVLHNRLSPSCSSANGMAFPPRRIVRTLQGIDDTGARVVLQSICDPTFDALTENLAIQLGERASGGC